MFSTKLFVAQATEELVDTGRLSFTEPTKWLKCAHHLAANCSILLFSGENQKEFKAMHNRWHFEDQDGQIVIFLDNVPVFYSALNHVQGGTLDVVKRFLDGDPTPIHMETRSAIERMFKFALDRNQHVFQIAQAICAAMNHVEQKKPATYAPAA